MMSTLPKQNPALFKITLFSYDADFTVAEASFNQTQWKDSEN